MPAEAEAEAGVRLVGLYWQQLVQLRVECEYFRRYQASLERVTTWVAASRAIVSVGALGTWAAVRAYPMVWGGIIAGAQVVDAVQRVIPFNRRYQGTTALVLSLDALFITALGEWEDTFAGRVDVAALTKARLRLMQQMHDAQAKYLPNGLPRKSALLKLAEADANAYFKAMFDMEDAGHGS